MKLLVILALVCAAEVARADVLPVPIECRPGSSYRRSHGGPWCEPTTCAASGECAAGSECRPYAVCVEKRELRSQHGSGGSDTFWVEHVLGPCAANASCAVGTCVEAQRCAPAAPRPEPEPEPATVAPTNPPLGATPKGCGCAGGAEAGLLGLLVLLARRRR